MSHAHTRPGDHESPPFHFETLWRVADPITSVWPVLTEVDAWAQWWPGIGGAVSLDGGVGVGSRARVTVRSPLRVAFALTLRIADIEPPGRVVLDAAGDLRGQGVWTLTQDGPITSVASVWCVTTRRRSVRLARPVSALMHAAVMRAGERGLRHRLGALT